MTGARIPCSVVVLTLNEERQIEACLDSVREFDDVHVLDSGSVDATRDLAAKHGAACTSNPFTSFGQQRNWAHDHLSLRYAWVLHLDADERVTPALAAEIRGAVARDSVELGGYMLAERTLLRGRWLRRSAQYPRYQARLVHRERMRFVDHGHGQRETSDLPFAKLQNPYDHLAFAQGLELWLRKHARYASQEAEQILTAMFSFNPVRRRRAIKRLAMRLPMRPALRMFHVLVVNRGVLDGRAGWEYALMMRVFQQMIDLSLLEARDRAASGARKLETAERLRITERET
jgi:hypothetical protein